MSPEQTAANRENSKLSTGPKTEAGKQRIKYNALRHGCYSATVVLPFEDHAEYETMGKELRHDYQPETPGQEEAVQKIQDTQWRRQRVLAIEDNLHTLGAQEHLAAIQEQFAPNPEDPDDKPLTTAEIYALAQASAYRENHRIFEQLARQEGRLLRMMGALQKYMTAVMQQRRKPETAALASATQASNIPDGFVRGPIPQMPVFSGPNCDFKRKQWLRLHGLTKK